MAHNSFGIKDKVWKLGAADEKGLEKQLDHLHLRLSVDESKGQNCLIMETSNSYTDSLSTTNAIYEPVKPLILRRTTGLVFMCVLVSAAVVLACFKRKEEANNGLTLPSNNRNVLNILESYLPTVFATIVGAVWILLTRTRCLLQPFQDLWTGKSKPSRSLDATYTSLPPQLVLVRAILSRHFILALLCIITLLGYVLSVGLASLFNEKPTTISNAQLFRPVVQSRFNNSFIMGYYHNTDADVETYNGYNEHKYITLANMTLGLTLPPWVSKEYYFLPHTIVKTGKTNSTDTYKLTTRGFGIDTTCASVPEAPINENTPESDYMSARRECPDILRSIRGWVNATVDAVGPSSQDAFLTWPQRDPINPCEKRFVMSWARLPKNGNTSTDITTSFAICQPSFRTAMFNITVDTDGYILDYKRVGEFNLTMTDSKSQNATDSLIITLNRAHRMSSQPSWRNDSYSNDWMSYFMVLENGRDFLDPNQPVPDPGTLIPSVNKIYKQLFATLLSVDKGFFEASSDINSVSGTRLTYETRIFMDEPAFIISMTILAFDLIVGIIFYARKPFFVLPRIPSSIGSVLAYIAPSRAVQNGKPKSGWGGQSFSFGKYIGYDGETHVGIELDPHVSRLDRSLLSGKKSSSLSLDSASVGGETSTVIQNNTEARPLLPTIPNKSQTRGRVDDDESNN